MGHGRDVTVGGTGGRVDVGRLLCVCDKWLFEAITKLVMKVESTQRS